jgi:hypothetical protein
MNFTVNISVIAKGCNPANSVSSETTARRSRSAHSVASTRSTSTTSVPSAALGARPNWAVSARVKSLYSLSFEEQKTDPAPTITSAWGPAHSEAQPLNLLTKARRPASGLPCRPPPIYTVRAQLPSQAKPANHSGQLLAWLHLRVSTDRTPPSHPATIRHLISLRAARILLSGGTP